MLARRFARTALPLQRRLLSTEHKAVFSRVGLSPDPSAETKGVYDGKWGGRGAVVESINPATGEVLARVREASLEDVEDTLKAARDAYLLWRTRTTVSRGLVLQDIGRALEKHRDDLGAVVSLEMGKIKSEGQGEVQVRPSAEAGRVSDLMCCMAGNH